MSSPGEIIVACIMGVKATAALSHPRAIRRCIEQLAIHLEGVENADGVKLNKQWRCDDIHKQAERLIALILTRP
jgi:hypothetical protein